MKVLLHQKTTALVYRTRAEHILIGGFARFRRTRACNFSIGLGAAVTVELPRVADLLNFVEVQVGDEELILVAAGLLDDFAARVAEITLAVKFADFPGSFRADAIDGSDEVGVGDCVSGLLKFPKIFREASDGGRGVVDDFGAVEAEDAGTFRKVS